MTNRLTGSLDPFDGVPQLLARLRDRAEADALWAALAAAGDESAAGRWLRKAFRERAEAWRAAAEDITRAMDANGGTLAERQWLVVEVLYGRAQSAGAHSAAGPAFSTALAELAALLIQSEDGGEDLDGGALLG